MTKVFRGSNHQVEEFRSTGDKPVLNLEDVARIELGETTATKAECLSRLRQLLKGEPTLKIPHGDAFLITFLRARKYRVEDAFKTIKNYFSMRRDMPEIFDGLVLEKVPFRTVCHDHKLFLISPEPGEHGRCVGVYKIGAWNPDVCSLYDMTRALLLLSSSWLLEDHPTICGVVLIADVKGLSVHHLAHYTPSYLMKVAHIAQNCWPVRIKAIYIINHPKIFEVVFAAIKPFLSSKMLSRMHFIGNVAPEFWKHFPRDLVPEEHGGSREHFDFDRQERLVRSKNAFHETLCACGYEKKQ